MEQTIDAPSVPPATETRPACCGYCGTALQSWCPQCVTVTCTAPPAPQKGADAGEPLDVSQERIREWAIRCFGEAHVTDPTIRGLCLIEEAIEFCQSVGVTPTKIHALVDYVYAHAPGHPFQELGGVLLTALAASSVAVSGQAALDAELARVLSKTPEYFAKRNQVKLNVKLNAGFTSAALAAQKGGNAGDWAKRITDGIFMPGAATRTTWPNREEAAKFIEDELREFARALATGAGEGKCLTPLCGAPLCPHGKCLAGLSGCAECAGAGEGGSHESD